MPATSRHIYIYMSKKTDEIPTVLGFKNARYSQETLFFSRPESATSIVAAVSLASKTWVHVEKVKDNYHTRAPEKPVRTGEGWGGRTYLLTALATCLTIDLASPSDGGRLGRAYPFVDCLGHFFDH